jgi:hypothetical protein
VLLRTIKSILKRAGRPIYHRLLERLRRDMNHHAILADTQDLRRTVTDSLHRNLSEMRQAITALDHKIAEMCQAITALDHKIAGMREIAPQIVLLQEELRKELARMAQSQVDFRLFMTQQVADEVVRLSQVANEARSASQAA